MEYKIDKASDRCWMHGAYGDTQPPCGK